MSSTQANHSAMLSGFSHIRILVLGALMLLVSIMSVSHSLSSTSHVVDHTARVVVHGGAGGYSHQQPHQTNHSEEHVHFEHLVQVGDVVVDDFGKTRLRIATVVSAENLPHPLWRPPIAA